MKKCICILLAGLLLLTGCGTQPGESVASLPSVSTAATTASGTTVTMIRTTAELTTTHGLTTIVKPTTTAATTTATTSSVSAPRPSSATTVTTMSTATVTTTARPEVTVTIPEGFSFMQIAKRLEEKGVCSAADFYAVCQNYTPQSFAISLSGDRCFRMEGYLFPDTYRFYVGDDPQTVLVRMLNNFRTKVGEIDEDTLILASIIEKEARSDTHMKMVSSVFHNRLNNRADFPYLNADPTRDYVNKYVTGNSLVTDQAKYAPLYNTCNKRRGLPAGPICSPGLRAIQAAKEPSESPYYYFFFGRDGDNHYSETLQEHEEKMVTIGVWLE